MCGCGSIARSGDAGISSLLCERARERERERERERVQYTIW
jgi:hypothetical protein